MIKLKSVKTPFHDMLRPLRFPSEYPEETEKAFLEWLFNGDFTVLDIPEEKQAIESEDDKV